MHLVSPYHPLLEEKGKGGWGIFEQIFPVPAGQVSRDTVSPKESDVFEKKKQAKNNDISPS